MVLLILCAPVWFRSSRLSRMRAPPTSCAQPRGVVDRARAADVVREVVLEFGDEVRVDARGVVGGGEFVQRPDQRLGDEAPAVAAEMAIRRRAAGGNRSATRPGLRRIASVGVAIGTTDFFDETPHLIAVLDPRRGFDAAGDVHRPGARRQTASNDVLRASGRRPARTACRRPVGSCDQSNAAAAAARLARGVAVEQEAGGAGIAQRAMACWAAASDPARASACALMYGKPKLRQNASSSPPWNCSSARADLPDHRRARRPAALSMNSATASTKRRQRVAHGARLLGLQAARAASARTRSRRASTPSSLARRTSPARVMPQNLMRVRNRVLAHSVHLRRAVRSHGSRIRGPEEDQARRAARSGPATVRSRPASNSPDPVSGRVRRAPPASSCRRYCAPCDAGMHSPAPRPTTSSPSRVHRIACRSRRACGAWHWTVRKALKSCSPSSACAAACIASASSGRRSQVRYWRSQRRAHGAVEDAVAVAARDARKSARGIRRATGTHQRIAHRVGGRRGCRPSIQPRGSRARGAVEMRPPGRPRARRRRCGPRTRFDPVHRRRRTAPFPAPAAPSPRRRRPACSGVASRRSRCRRIRCRPRSGGRDWRIRDSGFGKAGIRDCRPGSTKSPIPNPGPAAKEQRHQRRAGTPRFSTIGRAGTSRFSTIGRAGTSHCISPDLRKSSRSGQERCNGRTDPTSRSARLRGASVCNLAPRSGAPRQHRSSGRRPATRLGARTDVLRRRFGR